MSKRRSIIARAKKVEREVQQYLWPGTEFAGNAKRPALEDQDVRGFDFHGNEWWGEVKNYSKKNIKKIGVNNLLNRALKQCECAIDRNENSWYPNRPRSFAVLWPVYSRDHSERYVLLDTGDIVTLHELKSLISG